MSKNSGILIKTQLEIKKMAEGGSKLAEIKSKLKKAVKVGVSAAEIEKLATKLIEKSGGASSFKMVSGYKWSTCININEGVVHGIPRPEVVFREGDLVSVDVGLYYKGFHTDTSFSIGLNGEEETSRFLQAGRAALRKAVREVRPGKRIYDISSVIENTLEENNLSPIKVLVGHGIGRALHEEPQIPCFVSGERAQSPEISLGAVLAIEVMYSRGRGDVVMEADGWTISTGDGKIAALFEETVAATKEGPLVLT